MKTNDIPKKPEERRAWIKYKLDLLGCGFAAIARDLGVTRAAVNSVLRKRYPKMERIVAKKLGVRPEDLWPERYSPGCDDTNCGGRKQ